MPSSIETKAGPVRIIITEDEESMGEFTAEHITRSLMMRYEEGQKCVLWLMAAPSGFPFYQSFVEKAKGDKLLQKILREIHYFQFDDYPLSRQSKKFPVTFRFLLEKYFFGPLQNACNDLPYIHFLELNGTNRDDEIMKQYKDKLLDLISQKAYIIQLKGIGMDGHWGFHGAETPLGMKPDIIRVPMNQQNIHQQRRDWPDLFPSESEVPGTAVTFNVEMFLLANEIIDNVPQSTKEYAVLTTYGTEDIINEIPSSALKKHNNAHAYLTLQAANALLEFRNGRKINSNFKLATATLSRLRKIWDDPANPLGSIENIKVMEKVLKDLSIIS